MNSGATFRMDYRNFACIVASKDHLAGSLSRNKENIKPFTLEILLLKFLHKLIINVSTFVSFDPEIFHSFMKKEETKFSNFKILSFATWKFIYN